MYLFISHSSKDVEQRNHLPKNGRAGNYNGAPIEWRVLRISEDGT